MRNILFLLLILVSVQAFGCQCILPSLIDTYQGLTNDKALVDGHYYSEKAPLPRQLRFQ